MKLNQKQKALLEAALAKGNAAGKRDFWTSRLETMTASAQNVILGLLEMFPGEIGWFSGIQVRKEEAMKKRDTALWDAIVADEEKRLTALAAKI